MMRFEKRSFGLLSHCYAVMSMKVDGRDCYFYSPDDKGPCLVFDANGAPLPPVWDLPGGTMSMIPLPGQSNAFLASQNFFPGFQARECRIVKALWQNGTWSVQPWLSLPYVHRFDIIESAGRYWLLACILSGTDRPCADFENPGNLTVIELDPDLNPASAPRIIAGNMHRNHGYWRGCYEDQEWILTACDEGIFRVEPPKTGDSWKVTCLQSSPASDVALCDLDGDGQPELVTIAPFHGEHLNVYHLENGEFCLASEIPHHSSFLHGIWAGTVAGETAALIGGRAGMQETLLVQWKDGAYCCRTIEQQHGASNFFQLGDQMLVANREVGECALWSVRPDSPAEGQVDMP